MTHKEVTAMVDVTKPIVNPRLSEALAALHRENTPANQDRALREPRSGENPPAVKLRFCMT